MNFRTLLSADKYLFHLKCAIMNLGQDKISENEPTIPVWLDCDPGHDDAMAMILAAYHPKLRLLGISTCYGNQSHEKTLRNAVCFAKAAGITVDIVPGQSKPIMREPIEAPSIHGESGLDGTFAMPAFDESLILKANAVLHLAELLRSSKEKINLVATGPLTNYALLITLFPELKEKIEKLLFMGGAVGEGNWTPAAEYNILADPEAANIVMHSGLDVYMVPLEVTHMAGVTEKALADLSVACNDSEFSRLIVELMCFFKQTYKDVFGFDCPPLHDPCAVAALCCPNLFKFTRMGVDVITDNGATLGQTLCDTYNRFPFPKVNVATNIDAEEFMKIMMDMCALANERSPMNAK
ncbi:Inosine/uridine-preferring nucleoside hydrolase domain-containing protein [Radiomyces spectabilis]|uniref:Inosine/uridine-preferring nucleoside hydrolase domain-containing protein n=1 Tax=Radiomyces spectabilis TaxID=64574 RepID=UPI0022206C14|nr:Inosine/uridine-preferring nucleoside hydrolase domain-containing protein [Radiomyces spectabilis]KAI8394252.1 Inosine/uridine-preferring nucleoside hydrolase domain-containing protein [Radiomyces spectabilis]